MATYVQVPAQDIVRHLESRGFHRIGDNYQVVFEKSHPDARTVKIKVYTSIPLDGTAVKRRGKDSIRVCTVVEHADTWRESFGIGKFPSVFRVKSVDSVLRRIDERVEQAMARGTEWLRENAVKHVMGA